MSRTCTKGAFGLTPEEAPRSLGRTRVIRYPAPPPIMENTAAVPLGSTRDASVERRHVRAVWALRIAAAWLLTGALFKLFGGNPNLIPPLVRTMTPFSLVLTYHIAIAVELVLVVLALLRPRIGWASIAALFVFFIVLLVDLQMKGAASCGCFGEAIDTPPLLIMAVDATALVGVLATRPWSSLRGTGAPWGITGAAIALAIVLPWLVIRDHSAAVAPAGNASGAQTTSIPGNSGSSSSPVNPSTTGGQGNGSQNPPTAPHAPGTSGTPTTKVPAPPVDPSQQIWVELHPEKWTGKSIYDVAEFTKYVSTDVIPSDGRIVLWRQGCTHCAAHLREMANETIDEPILLVQVPDDLKDSRAVDAMPSGPNVTQIALPSGTVGLFETPFEVRVEGGVVKQVLFKDDFEKSPK
jgi:hypothetical protein